MTNRSLTLLVHGGPKLGKTTFGGTSPYPRLILDAEGGTRFLKHEDGRPHLIKIWDPLLEGVPVADGTWETCVVYVRDYATVQRVYQWLAIGQHQFRSVVMDSISEIQQRCVDAIAGVDAMKQQDWGDLLRQMSVLVRQFRDLTIHPTNALEAVVIIAMGREFNGKQRPYVQGQLATTLPYYLDVYAALIAVPAADGTSLTRYLLTSPLYAQYEAGDRTGMLPPSLENPRIDTMLDLIYGSTNGAAAPVAEPIAPEAVPAPAPEQAMPVTPVVSPTA